MKLFRVLLAGAAILLGVSATTCPADEPEMINNKNLVGAVMFIGVDRGGNIAGSVWCHVPCGRHMPGNDQEEPGECGDVSWCRIVGDVHTVHPLPSNV